MYTQTCKLRFNVSLYFNFPLPIKMCNTKPIINGKKVLREKKDYNVKLKFVFDIVTRISS